MTLDEIRALVKPGNVGSFGDSDRVYVRISDLKALITVVEAAKNPACFWQTIECSSAELQEHITARKKLIAAQTALEKL